MGEKKSDSLKIKLLIMKAEGTEKIHLLKVKRWEEKGL